METLHDVSRWLHVGLGTFAFAGLWTAGLSRKGGGIHRLAGRVYVWALCGVCATAAVLTLTTFARGPWEHAAFLAYLLCITATSLWFGWRALRFKGNAKGYAGGLFLPVGILNIAAGLVVLVIGILAMEPFIIGVSSIGLIIGWGVVAIWRSPPDLPRFWLREHIGGMIGAGIATHIAFASIAIRKLFPELDGSIVSVWPWLAPLIIGFTAAGLADRHYVERGAPLNAEPDGAPVAGKAKGK